jgi:hypothetical protein
MLLATDPLANLRRCGITANPWSFPRITPVKCPIAGRISPAAAVPLVTARARVDWQSALMSPSRSTPWPLSLALLLAACDGDGGDDGEESATGEGGGPPAVAWTKVAEAAGSPAARTAAALAYDDDRGVIVLHGGLGGGKPFDDTWVWDGAWTEVVGAGGPARGGHAMAWDPVGHQVILFDGTFKADTWAFDGATWTELTPATAPSGRQYAAMTTDRGRQRAVLFGGLITTGAASDTWEWDGATWIEQDPAVRPPGRGSHAMAYDEARGEVVIVGGQTTNYAFDTWAWDGEAWTERTPVIEALSSPRQGLVAGYHPELGGVVFHGGLANFTGIKGRDAWLLEGMSWTRLEPPEDPGSLFYHAMIGDPKGGGVLLVDDAGGTWRLGAL